MAKKQKPKPVKTEAQIFSELLISACDKYGTKTVADEMGVTVRSVQVWKHDASKMNLISLIGARDVINSLAQITENEKEINGVR